MNKKARIQKPEARILVVDDEPEVAETIRDLLVFSGFDVEVAKNGKQAIDLFKSTRHFDLIITDMKMPGIDGLELLRMVRQSQRDLPVIILTGHGTFENAIQSLEEGAIDYVLKPFNTEKLVRAVRRALLRRS